MSRTRVAAALAVVGLGAAGLVPAVAAPSTAPATPPAAVVRDADRALRDAVAALAPDERSVIAWRTAVLDQVAEDEGYSTSVSASTGSARESAYAYGVGDVDGDRREETAVYYRDGIVVRSGRDGRALLRRPENAFLLAVTGAGKVRLLSYEVEFVDHEDSFDLTMRLQGLDARGRTVWEHESTGTVGGAGFGPAYVSQLDAVPYFFDLDQQDAQGRPSMVLGTLTAEGPRPATVSRTDLTWLSLADGTATPLASVEGRGRGYADAYLVEPSDGAGTCYATLSPTGPVSRVGLACDGGEPEWQVPLLLRDAYLDVEAGDFDGDGRDEISATTFGDGGDPRPQQVLRGTRVLSRSDGSTVGTSALDDLEPTGGDADGDGTPDFLRFAETAEGFGVQGVNLAGDVLYEAGLQGGEGLLDIGIGLDVTGDGVCDAYLRAAPRRGTPTALVVDGSTGRTQRVKGVDSLLAPGLRRTGMDLTASTLERGRLRTTVLSGDRGRRLLDVRVTGPAGAASFSGAGAVELDRDGRKDLVVVSRAGQRRLTSAFSAAGLLLWQTVEAAPPLQEDTGVLVGFAG